MEKILFVQAVVAQGDDFQNRLVKENPAGLEIMPAFDLKSALSNLEFQNIDIVLLDFNLPDSRGLDTFLAISKKFPKVPVVIICRKQDEALAKQALEKGAQDYLLKEELDFKILAGSLKHSLENKKNQLSIDEFRQNYFSIAENVCAGLAVLDPKGNIVYANKTAQGLFGLEGSNQPDLKISDFLVYESQGKALEELFKIFSSQDNKPTKVTFKNKSGKYFSLEVFGKKITHNSQDANLLILCTSSVAGEGFAHGLDADSVQIVKANEELAVEIQQRHKAEEALRYRLELGKIINILSTHFINVPLDEIDDGINGALQTMAEFIKFDRSYIFLFSRKDNRLVKAYEWWGENSFSGEQKFNEISDKSLPCLMERLVKLEMINIPSIERFVAASANQAQARLVAPRDIKSFVAIPMVYGGFLMGFLGFDVSRQEISLPDDIASQLKIAGEIFVNALVRKETEEMMNSEKERLAVTLRSIKDAVIATDIQGKITLVNRAAEELTGWRQEEATGREFDDIVQLLDAKTHQLASNGIHEALRGGRAVDIYRRVILLSKTGAEKFVVDRSATLRSRSSMIIGAVAVIRDVTVEQRMEDELFKKQKLESLGLLAGGIAHDFNNILTSMLSNISLMKMQENLSQDMKEMLDETEKATLQATKLTHQLLTIAKGGALVKKTASLSELLKDTAQFVLRGSRVKCELLIDENLWPVDIDVDQIAQVIQNMVINAEQAMPNGGVLNIFANNIMVDESLGLPVWSGRYIKISIRDQGVGISPEQLKRLFEPYFTTKPKGNGLGLATAYSIIKRHEGHISVESQQGQGTTFQIYLPASQKIEPAKAKLQSNLAKGKVLVMDDEDLVRRAIQRALSSVGYKVEMAADGPQTLKLYKEAMDTAEPFDVVMLDLNISGGIGGKEVIEKLIKIDPKVKGIASSGYSTDAVMTDFSNYGFRAAIVKPYNIEEISKAIDKVIAEK